MRMPEYTSSRIMLAVKPFIRLKTPSERAIWVPTVQNALEEDKCAVKQGYHDALYAETRI